MTSQNIPGVAVMRSSGYQTPVSPLISWTGFTSIMLAPLGGFAFNLAAITAAICSGDECHKDPKRRYIAGLSAGVFYWLAGLAGTSVVALFSIFPATMIAALAGIALLGTIGMNLKNAMADDSNREAALVTFLVTVSGVSFGGIASAFWGILFGVICLLISNIKLK
jgi:benzoate membrane transport protein